jgi:hypothetical protein
MTLQEAAHRLLALLGRLFLVEYSSRPEERSFLERAQSRQDGGVKITVAVPSDREAERIFGVHLSHRGLQASWLEVVNRSNEPLRLDRVHFDPDYFTPLEAANLARFAVGERAFAFGLLGWLFLPLLPLLPLKLWSAHRANLRIARLFENLGFPGGTIAPGHRVCGFLFTPLDEAVKRLNVRLLNRGQALEFHFTVEVPGLKIPPIVEAMGGQNQELDEAGFRAWLMRQPRCTSDSRGGVEGDPLNLVIIGDRRAIEECFSSWDATETLTLTTAWKTARAFIFESRYRYSPVSPLYLKQRQQDLALQRARSSLNQRLHLRLWTTGVSFERQPVWIGQVSRDIGVRFTVKTWNLTTHLIDPDVDDARDYVLNGLLAVRRVKQLGLVPGVEPAPRAHPRRNLTGDPYFTDGRRGVAMLSPQATEPALLDWNIAASSEADAAIEAAPVASPSSGTAVE